MANAKRNPLPVPDAVSKDASAVEVLRAWRSPNGAVYVSWEEKLEGGSVTFGRLLAAIANVMAAEGGAEKAEASLSVMRREFQQIARKIPSEIPDGFPKLFEYNQIVTAFHEETDRAAGILSAAWLDSYLGQCLRYFMVHDGESEKLVGSERELDKPLASFKVRARALFVLGLLSKAGLMDIDRIVSIRNHFAHHPNVTSFENEKVAGWCSNLRSAKLGMGEMARDRYLLATSFVAVELHNAMFQHDPCEVRPDLEVETGSANSGRNRVKV